MLFQNITSMKRSNSLQFCQRVFKIAVTVLIWNITMSAKYVETTAVLTSSCTVKYPTHLEALLLHFQRMSPRETGLEEGSGGDAGGVNLSRTTSCPQTGRFMGINYTLGPWFTACDECCRSTEEHNQPAMGSVRTARLLSTIPISFRPSPSASPLSRL